jgi:Flp pilus assembly secretin CpaC
MPLLRSILALALVGLALAPAAALADPSNEPISVKVNMARILKINAPAATVIIGNPGVADVTIQDPQTLVLTGKSYGETNLIVLDSQGAAIADTLVSVVQPQSGDDITVFQGLARQTLNCQPVCQPTVSLGDDTTFSGTTLGSSTTLQSMAAH